MISLGIEGSANKVGVGIYRTSDKTVLSNQRKTFIAPTGEGFLPKETAAHHRAHVLELIKNALIESKLSPNELDCICFTQGITFDDQY